MRRIPAIKTVMTAFPYSVDIHQTIDYANDFLTRHELGHLPITDKDELVGVISKRDVRFHLVAQNSRADAKVSDLPMADKYVVDLNERLDQVLETMADKHLDAALVTRNGRLAGIFTLSDVCRNFARFLTREYNPPGGNEAA